MASIPHDVDPRGTIGSDATVDQGILPTVAVRRPGLPNWALAGLALVAAILLFTILDARRRSLQTQEPERVATTDALTPPPPPLALPPGEEPVQLTTAPEAPAQPAPAPAAPAEPQIVYVPQPTPPPVAYQNPEPMIAPMPQPRAAAGGSALVIDNSQGGAPATTPPAATGEGTAAPTTPGSTAIVRARSGVFANRSTTVPQGTLIPAVLETALDSTRPGFARAIVSRDVRGFDGTQVLIPRGSRLIGEYRSEAALGQRRALVNWIRLIRPDGVTIAIESPAGDPLGRGGIRARVNSHFFERFFGALLQSALTIGGAVATTAIGDGGVFIALPGQLQGATQVVPQTQITPTLSVRHGTSISIFVSRDLDFTGANGRR